MVKKFKFLISSRLHSDAEGRTSITSCHKFDGLK